MRWSGGKRQCPDRSAATVKLLPKVGWEYLFLASPGAAFRTRVASTRGCDAVAFGVVSDEVEGMMHGRRGNVLTRLVLSLLSSSLFSFHFISFGGGGGVSSFRSIAGRSVSCFVSLLFCGARFSIRLCGKFEIFPEHSKRIIILKRNSRDSRDSDDQ